MSSFVVFQSFPVMVGDMDNTGSLNAQIIHQLTSRLRSKVAMQVFIALQACFHQFESLKKKFKLKQQK